MVINITNLKKCSKCINAGKLNICGNCYNKSKFKKKEKNRKLIVTLSCKDLDIVSNAVKVINNNIVKKGYFSDYDKELLSALLGENWEKEYCIGMILL